MTFDEAKRRMEELIAIIEKYNYHYYVLDDPLVSDKVWDKLYYELLDLETKFNFVFPSSPSKKVGGDPISAFEKVEHKRRLYSLGKSQTEEELEDWFVRNQRLLPSLKDEFSVEYKYDGLSIALTYKDGLLVRGATRGNGVFGEDVTEQVKTIRTVPLRINFKGTLEIQGEILMRLSEFEKWNQTHDEKLKNARNAAAGSVRNLDPKVTAQRRLDAVMYNINYIDGEVFDSQEKQYEFMKNQGFLVGSYFKIVKGLPAVKKELSAIVERRSSLDFLIDGAVIKFNSKSTREELGFTDKFPRGMVAYKFEAEETSTMLNDVVWQVGRTGKLTPIAVLDPVELGGVTVKRATLNNYNDILKKKVKLNSMVLIRRSNDVIPEIMGVMEEFDNSKPIEKPNVCPCCGTKLTETIANLFCPNHLLCKDQVVRRLSHFVSKHGMNIEGLSSKTIEQLFDRLGVSTFADIYLLSAEKLASLEGFKDKKISNLLTEIEDSKQMPLANFIYAIGIEEVGRKTANQLAKHFKTFDSFKNAAKEELVELPDIAEKIADEIIGYFSDEFNAKQLERLAEVGVVPSVIEERNDLPLSGQKFVLTGTLSVFSRDDATKLLESLGADVLTSVSKNTTCVVAGANAGSKLKKAEALGVKVINEDEFQKIIENARAR